MSNIYLLGIKKEPIEIKRSDLMSVPNDIDIIHECSYTSILHHLSFKKTIKNEGYLLLDNILNIDNGKIVISELDRKKIIKSIEDVELKKRGILVGVPRLYLLDNPILNDRSNVSRYLASKYKDAFYSQSDYLIGSIAENLFNYKFSKDKLFKYSEGLYSAINKYLNTGKLFLKYKIPEIVKIINVIDEMFMISPLSEDNMILYRGIDKGSLNYLKSEELEKNMKLGIQKQYMSTTKDALKGFEYTVKSEYNSYKDKYREGLFSRKKTKKEKKEIEDNKQFHKALKILADKKITSLCCFVVFHLEDGIPYIDLNKLSRDKNEVLLPRGLELKYMKTQKDFKLKIGIKYAEMGGVLDTIKSLLGNEFNVTAHHVSVKMTPELKKLYKKGEKCLEYNIYEVV